tara:strand:+ start:143 stop:751 length:609 start_codon:yes stop_codon:yes gene_type:complete
MVRQIRPSAVPPQVQARRDAKVEEGQNPGTAKGAPVPELPQAQARRRTTSPVPSEPSASGVSFSGPRRPSAKPASENLVPEAAVTDISGQMQRKHPQGNSPKERAEKALVYLQVGVQNAPPNQAKTRALLTHLEQLAHQVADSVKTGNWDRADVAFFSQLVHDGLNRAQRVTPDGPQVLWYERYFVEPLKTQHLDAEMLKLF